MQRTVRVRLEVTPAQAAVLAETAAQFTAVFNAVCAYGWRKAEKNGVRLHHALYKALKAQYPNLVSDHHIQARVKATEAVKSALTLATRGKRVSRPASVASPPRYNVHTYKVDWEQRTVRISTTGGRQTLPFHIPTYAERYAGRPVDTADLIQDDGRWWLHIVVTLPVPDAEPSPAVVGVDLGLAQPAVTSTAKFLGQKRWRDRETRLFNLKRALQKAGTKSAKRHLQRVRHNQARFRRDCDHVLSRQIVHAVAPGGTIVLENLKEIRSRVKQRKGAQSRRLHSWSFAQLKQFVTYKAEERGCTVVGVDPRHTSQTCPKCGHVARNNRRSRSWFRCRSCGYQLHADLVGARNVAAKYRAGRSTSPADGPPVKRPLVGAACTAVHDSTHKLTASAVGA